MAPVPAVHEVLAGATVTDVAKRNGVTRQTVHTWLRRYADPGVAGLVDKASKFERCPHQMAPGDGAGSPDRGHAARSPVLGPRTIGTHLDREGVTPLPNRSAIYRALVRHRLLEPTPRKRSLSDYKRWERSRSMELWQMDIVGRFFLADGTEVKVVTGVDDHSRDCVCAPIVARTTAKPECDALVLALKQHGVPTPVVAPLGCPMEHSANCSNQETLPAPDGVESDMVPSQLLDPMESWSPPSPSGKWIDRDVPDSVLGQTP